MKNLTLNIQFVSNGLVLLFCLCFQHATIAQRYLSDLINDNHYIHFQESPLTIQPNYVNAGGEKILGYALHWDEKSSLWVDTVAVFEQFFEETSSGTYLKETLKSFSNSKVDHLSEMEVFYVHENWRDKSSYPDSVVFKYKVDEDQVNWTVLKQAKYLWGSDDTVSQRAVRLADHSFYDTIDGYWSEDWQVKFRFHQLYNPVTKNYDTTQHARTILPWIGVFSTSRLLDRLADTLITKELHDTNLFDNNEGYVTYVLKLGYVSAYDSWLMIPTYKFVHIIDFQLYKISDLVDTSVVYGMPLTAVNTFYTSDWTLPMVSERDVFNPEFDSFLPDTTWRKEYGYDPDGFLEHITISKRNGFFNDFVPLYKWYFTEKTSIGVEPSQQMPLTLSKLSNSAYRIQHPQLEFISAHYQLLNVQGQILSSFSSGQPNVDFELSSFPAGIYFIVVTTPTQRITFKLFQ